MSYPFQTRPTFGNNRNDIWKAKPSSAALPLYKDKPLSKTSGAGTSSEFITSISGKSSRTVAKMLFRASLVAFVVYLVYHIGVTMRGEDAEESSDVWLTRRNEVRTAFLDSWHDYEANGWGYDVYHPVSQTGKNMGPKPLGWIIVDSLDTLMLMDCAPELERAKAWVKDDLTYDFNYDVNVFETTIRMLGGFLSAFYLSQDDVYLDKAVDLGNRLMKGFESRTGIPYASVNLGTGRGVKSHADGGASSTAEVATLQLEFKYLAKLTGESLYWEKVERIMSVLDASHPKDGLVPIFVHPESGLYQGKLIRLGSRGDSYYEYLLKQYLQTGETIYQEMYEEAVYGIKKHMVSKSKPNGYTYIGELPGGVNGALDPKMDHLVCFIGGLFALGATGGRPINEARQSPSWSTTKEANFMLGKEITHTCYKMYHDVDFSGLAPEIVVFNTDPKSISDFHIKPADRHNLQRPETVESLYYLYKITKDPMYRRWGYEIFQNFVKHTKVNDGGPTRYTSLQDVTTGKQRDNMESFWLAETLKYLYLLFDDDDKLDLTAVVFNTEAHVFPVFEADPLFKTGWTRSSGYVGSGDEPEPVPDVEEKVVQKPKMVKKPVENIAIKDSGAHDHHMAGGAAQDGALNEESDFLEPQRMADQKAAQVAVNPAKPKIQAEVSFNENDKKIAMGGSQQQAQAAQAAQAQAQAPVADAVRVQGQKPAQPIDEAVKELQEQKRAAGAADDAEQGKIFKDKDEINQKLEELIQEADV